MTETNEIKNIVVLNNGASTQWDISYKRNAFELVLMRWMNLEPIIQSEVSQKGKDRCHVLTHIYMESRKMVLRNLSTGQQWRCRHREQTFEHSWGERSWDDFRE